MYLMHASQWSVVRHAFDCDVWWTRTHVLQARAAVLQEVTSAVKLLVQCQQFSTAAATAVGRHIKQHVTDCCKNFRFNQEVCLEHAMLLELDPLRELLDFLWVQLGLRRHVLEPFATAQALLGLSVCYCVLIYMDKLCRPQHGLTSLSTVLVHKDGSAVAGCTWQVVKAGDT